MSFDSTVPRVALVALRIYELFCFFMWSASGLSRGWHEASYTSSFVDFDFDYMSVVLSGFCVPLLYIFIQRCLLKSLDIVRIFPLSCVCPHIYYNTCTVLVTSFFDAVV